MLAEIAYPHIDPVLFHVTGPLALRWYGFMWVVGYIAAWATLYGLARRGRLPMTPAHAGDFITWIAVGTIVGGRVGDVFFYRPDLLLTPSRVFRVWEGGMSFHGGILGVALAGWLFSRYRAKCSLWEMCDGMALATPVGIFTGRIANFINSELYGRVTESPLGMVFPGGGPLPRHPSQLYEAFLEGLVLFLVLLWFARRRENFERTGFLGGVFLAGYGIARPVAEFFREPDAHIGFLTVGTTMGQWLSLPLLIAGIWLVVRSRKNVAA